MWFGKGTTSVVPSETKWMWVLAPEATGFALLADREMPFICVVISNALPAATNAPALPRKKAALDSAQTSTPARMHDFPAARSNAHWFEESRARKGRCTVPVREFEIALRVPGREIKPAL